MRVLMVLVALVATPVFVCVSQDRGQAATRVSGAGLCATADEHRSPTSWENSGRPEDVKGRDRVGCAPVAPASCNVAPAAGGASWIRGFVQRRVEPFDVLPGWCLELSGAASGSDLTDGSGIYAFNSLAAGKYLVCLVVPSGWRQTHPSSGASDALCPSGNYGRKFTADGGSGASGMWFGVVPQ